VLGKEHPHTATTYDNIAAVYRNQGKYDEALELHQKALYIRENVLGKEHPYTAYTYENIARVYSDQGKYVEALEWCCKGYRILLHRLGDTHPHTMDAENSMRVVYRKAELSKPFEQWLQMEINKEPDHEKKY